MASNIFTVTNVTYAFTATLINNSIQVSSTDTSVRVLETLTTVTTTSTVQTTEIVEKGVVSIYRPATVTVDTFSGNGSSTVFTLSSDPVDNESVEIIIGGVGQIYGEAFTVSGRTVTFTGAPPAGTNNISIQYFDVNVGFRGPTGPSGGYVGSMGVSGPQGPLGYTGSIGYVGSQSTVSGPTGASGPQGPLGYFGSIGYIGSKGVTGPTGPAQAIVTGWVTSGTSITSGNLKLEVGYYTTIAHSSNGNVSTGSIGLLWSTMSGTQTLRSDNSLSNTATVTTSVSPVMPYQKHPYTILGDDDLHLTVADFDTQDAWSIHWISNGSASGTHFISIERLD